MALSTGISRSFSAMICRTIYHSSKHKSFPRFLSSSQCVKRVTTPRQCSGCLRSLQSQQRITPITPARSIYSAADTDGKSIVTTQPTDTLSKVSGEISSLSSRLFAVIYIHGKQYKGTTNDLIQVGVHMEPDIGERIRLEKVLLVGGDNFTIIGRPLLVVDLLDQVRIEATVIEKTVSQKHIKYLWVKRSGFKKYKEFITNYTVLRINSIDVSPKLQ